MYRLHSFFLVRAIALREVMAISASAELTVPPHPPSADFSVPDRQSVYPVGVYILYHIVDATVN